MDEARITDRLRRYRPAGPPPELRMFALGPARPGRLWPWAAAAAVLLAATLAVHEASSRTLSRYATSGDTSDSVEALAEALGGGEDARRAAEWIVADRQWRAQVGAAAAADRDEVTPGGY